MPLFPGFEWDGYFWTTTAIIPAWGGYQAREGAYGGQSSDLPAIGLIRIVFAPEGRDDSPMRPEEVSQVQWAIEHGGSVEAAAAQAVFAQYPEWQADFHEDEVAEFMPDIKTTADLKKLMGITSINVHQISASGLAYIGIELGCTWDVEHGIGVLLHGTRVVDVGGADTAILLWIAKLDAEKQQ